MLRGGKGTSFPRRLRPACCQEPLSGLSSAPEILPSLRGQLTSSGAPAAGRG